MKPEDIFIDDIAVALSNKCRYTGHVSKFYSVAEHSVHVCNALPHEFKLWGLMHDATEAYLPDVASPVKPHIQGFKDIENRLMQVIADTFDLGWPEPKEVKDIDNLIRFDEQDQLVPFYMGQTGPFTIPRVTKIEAMLPNEAREFFIERYYRLINKKQ